MRFFLSWRTGLALIAVLAVVGGGLAWWLTRPGEPKGALETLKARGAINIGVRAHSPPFSAVNGPGSFIGFEPEIARALASALGVRPHFVAIEPATAADSLQRGLVDVVFLPRGSLNMRSGTLRALEPGYFASGFNAVTLTGSTLTNWDDLKDLTICGLGGAGSAQRMVEELGGHYIAFEDMTAGLQALAAERCKAFVNDEVALSDVMKADAGHRYSMPLETLDLMPWTLTVRASDTQLADALAHQLAEWHKSGFLIERATNWHLPESHYLEAMRAYYGSN
jgi:polar amino acid transport system substrate-binding protein